jgi:glycosyltransferase involved in cell wall biosynthesis
MKPDVTIGIVVKSDFHSVRRTLEALKKNTAYPYYLLIINDLSNPKTNAYLENLQNINRIKDPKNQSIPQCANLLIEKTETPYLVLLESNAYVTKGWLDLLMNCLKSRPEHGIAGPSTSWAWNEQQVLGCPQESPSEIESFGRKLNQEYGDEIRYLDQLHSIGDFCYAFKREVSQKIGYFDERYDKGPCFEIDYNTRAARAGYKCVWVCGVYVHRYRGSGPRIQHERDLFLINKQLYQEKFCGLRLHRKRKAFCDHCLGESCEHFAPSDLITTTRLNLSGESSKQFNEKPLISCIMPTFNRRFFIPQSIKYFLSQDYPNKELIIVDDGTDPVMDIVPTYDQIKYINLRQKASIGYKRNLAVKKSEGEIIAHWDDDDWYSEKRLSYQIQPLLEGTADLCGLDTGYIYNIEDDKFWSCDSKLHAMMFYADIHGGSIMFTRDLWDKFAKYPNISLGEDAAFLRGVKGKVRIKKLQNKEVFMYVRHNKNAWEFICGNFIKPNAWKVVNQPEFLKKDDLEFYKFVSTRI